MLFLECFPNISKRKSFVFLLLSFSTSYQDYGKCPVTGEQLTMDDIVAVKTNKVLILIDLVFDRYCYCYNLYH